MRMNRRNVLVGLGTIVTGGGAALGTGAFSSVTADRTFTVAVADDANAFLALKANEGLTSDALSDSGGVNENELEIDLSAAFGTAAGDGVNDNAVTTIGQINDTDDGVETAAFTITNNSSNAVDVGVDVGGTASMLKLQTEVAEADHDYSSADFRGLNDLNGNDIKELVSGGTADVVVVIDTTPDSIDSSSEVTGVTFTADATESTT